MKLLIINIDNNVSKVSGWGEVPPMFWVISTFALICFLYIIISGIKSFKNVIKRTEERINKKRDLKFLLEYVRSNTVIKEGHPEADDIEKSWNEISEIVNKLN